MLSGLVILNQEAGLTSQSAVLRVRRLFGADKAGHTGTLAPMATGVLPVLIGRAVKAGEYLICGDKHYIATLRLGLTTDTEDVTGRILTSSDKRPGEEEVYAAARRFLGTTMQTPPMYSALKVGGKKLVDLARAGIEVERAPRPVTVFSLRVERLSESDYLLDVVCSKGTYIRTLCADIGRALGCGGVMAALCRAEAAGFTLQQAHTLAQLEAMTEKEREQALYPVEALFSDLKNITLAPFFSRLARCGAEIYLRKIGLSANVGERVRLSDERGFFALGEVREFADGPAIKPIKQFDV